MMNLPENFVTYDEARKAGFMKMKELKEKGARTAGIFCSFVPVEILMAGGVVNASLCASSDTPLRLSLPADPCCRDEAAEKPLPVNQGQLWLCADRYLPVFLFRRSDCGGDDLRRKEKDV